MDNEAIDKTITGNYGEDDYKLECPKCGEGNIENFGKIHGRFKCNPCGHIWEE